MTTVFKKYKDPILNVVYPLISLGLMIGVWAIASSAMKKPMLLPMPSEVFKDFFGLFGDSAFWINIGWSLARILECFLLSFVLAFVTAVLGGASKTFHRIISPIVTVLRAAPTMAVILLAMIWIDYGNAPILVGFLIAYPILYSAFYTAITGVPKDLLEMARVYHLRPQDKLTGIYIPQILPAVFDVSKSTLSLTAKTTIAAEVLCHTKLSIGLQMQRANLTFDISELMAWTVVAILLSFMLEGVIVGIRKIWETARR